MVENVIKGGENSDLDEVRKLNTYNSVKTMLNLVWMRKWQGTPIWTKYLDHFFYLKQDITVIDLLLTDREQHFIWKQATESMRENLQTVHAWCVLLILLPRYAIKTKTGFSSILWCFRVAKRLPCYYMIASYNTILQAAMMQIVYGQAGLDHMVTSWCDCSTYSPYSLRLLSSPYSLYSLDV